MSAIKRRDWLKRQVAKGNMEARMDFYFDPQYEQDTAERKWKPARLADGVKDMVDGFFNLMPWDFTGKSGRCWQESGGNLVLWVHSNKIITLRFKQEAA